MATIASLVANPIFLRNPHPKFSAAKLSATYNSRHASVSFSSSAPKFNVNVKLKSFFSAAGNNQYSTTTTDSKVLGRHASLCKPPNAIKDHLGIGKPLGRVGGKWSTGYPYNPTSSNPSENPFELVFLFVFFFLYIALMVCSGYRSMWFKASVLIILAVLLALLSWACGKTSVVKLQVGFSGKGRDLGFDLNHIAETADTSTYEGLSYVLNETIVALLRHHEYYNSSSISVVSKFGRAAANSHIDQLSVNERVKNKETLVNVNNTKLQSPTSQKSTNDRHNDDIMVTLFVGVKWGLELPTIYNKYDLENVLQKFRVIGSSNYLTAVETLWTPQVSSCSAATSIDA
ncbi:uncharacterized protein LOC112199596 [Rosa chinensis]|uniref:uncharacterized protein LOC112199596 n=1 Tax=Rosa chinensis TaxID=74649 RepID=UPI000D08F1E0|nr:uncharacterized protein LOC112199596 [Rosa chinensis]